MLSHVFDKSRYLLKMHNVFKDFSSEGWKNVSVQDYYYLNWSRLLFGHQVAVKTHVAGWRGGWGGWGGGEADFTCSSVMKLIPFEGFL